MSDQANQSIRPRRSCLYMPGSNTRALAKARTLEADAVIIDLEDAVAPDAKQEARAVMSAAIDQGGFGKREVIVRINGLSTEWGQLDLEATMAAKPDGILVPKVCNAADIDAIDQAMDNCAAPADMILWVMIEMPEALFHLHEIASKAASTRLGGFVLGTNDLAKELIAIPTPDRLAFQTSLSLSVAAARANGIAVIDGVFNDIQDTSGFEAECTQGRTLGFDGKTLIHPAQIEVANRIFAPDPQELAQARAVIDAFSLPENSGKGVLKVNGKMTELLHLEQARRMIAMDETIRA